MQTEPYSLMSAALAYARAGFCLDQDAQRVILADHGTDELLRATAMLLACRIVADHEGDDHEAVLLDALGIFAEASRGHQTPGGEQ